MKIQLIGSPVTTTYVFIFLQCDYHSVFPEDHDVAEAVVQKWSKNNFKNFQETLCDGDLS